ncbi:MAG: SDR family oxidoreductase, partial [Puia sp.]
MNTGPVVIVTGASGGTGNALALAYAQKGFSVAAVDQDEAGLKRLESMWQPWYPEYASFPGDLADPEFLLFLVDSVVKKWGRIDVLINNAAWRTLETLRTISMDNWEKTIRICLTAPAFLTKYVCKEMEAANIKGVVINIGSV